jgi:hypothetical protein
MRSAKFCDASLPVPEPFGLYFQNDRLGAYQILIEQKSEIGSQKSHRRAISSDFLNKHRRVAGLAVSFLSSGKALDNFQNPLNKLSKPIENLSFARDNL